MLSVQGCMPTYSLWFISGLDQSISFLLYTQNTRLHELNMYVSTMTDSLVLNYNKGEPAIKLLDYVSTQLRMSR